MDREFTRTSVTVDEAVAILLGWVDGPIWFRSTNDNPSPEEQEVIDSLIYSLQEDLENDKEQAESDLAEAKNDKMDECVIESKHEAVRKAAADRALAKTYLCAIEDEINKGPMSALRVDVKRTSSHQTYITLTSFDDWAGEKGYRLRVLEPVPTITQPSVEVAETKSGKPPVRRRHRGQEKAIVAEIVRLGYNPLELPINSRGKRGVKTQVRDALWKGDLFGTINIFKHAWDRLRAGKEIVDICSVDEGIAPPKKQ